MAERRAPRYQCQACGQRVRKLKSDGTLPKHGKCHSGQAAIDRGECWETVTRARLPASEVSSCPMPPDPLDATPREMTLFRGDAWDKVQAAVIRSEDELGPFDVWHMDGRVIGVRGKTKRTVILSEADVDAVREHLSAAELMAKLAECFGRARELSGTHTYPGTKEPCLYERVWSAGQHLVAVLKGEEFTRTKPVTRRYANDAEIDGIKEARFRDQTTLSLDALARACGGEVRVWLGDDPGFHRLVAERAEAVIGELFTVPQPWEWWEQFTVLSAWGQLGIRRARSELSYQHGRRPLGRSCIRVLAEYLIYPYGPLGLDMRGEPMEATA